MEIKLYDTTAKAIMRLLLDYADLLQSFDSAEMSGQELVNHCHEIGEAKGTATWLERQLEKQNEPTQVYPTANPHNI